MTDLLLYSNKECALFAAAMYRAEIETRDCVYRDWRGPVATLPEDETMYSGMVEELRGAVNFESIEVNGRRGLRPVSSGRLVPRAIDMALAAALDEARDRGLIGRPYIVYPNGEMMVSREYQGSAVIVDLTRRCDPVGRYIQLGAQVLVSETTVRRLARRARGGWPGPAARTAQEHLDEAHRAALALVVTNFSARSTSAAEPL